MELTAPQKLENMKRHLRGLDRVAVALSGGVDSAFVLKVAADVLTPEGVLAFTGKSPSLAREELDAAVDIARRLGIQHLILDTDEVSRPDYARNAPDRCYHCKTTLYDRAKPLFAPKGYHLVNGTNADDLGDYRPGLRAAAEHDVAAPAAEAGLTKAEIREFSRAWGLPTADKPASPCLSSRIAYGESVTPEKLRMIEEAERFLRGLGLAELRVRLHTGHLARIEVPADRIAQLAEPALRDRIDQRFREVGFQYVTLDLRGFRSGSLNELISLEAPSPRVRRAAP